jgi:hypothetical protein
MNKDQILRQYNKVVGTDSKKARELVKKLNFRNDPYLLQCIAQTYYDESLFNADGSYRDYFDGRKLRLAEKYVIKAYTINEDCINVLWTLGKIRHAFKQIDLAIYCFQRIIEIETKNVPDEDTCTNREFVSIKVNDSRFHLYRLYHVVGDLKTSKKYLSLYKKNLSRGLKSLYTPLKKFLMDDENFSGLKAFPEAKKTY